MLIRAIVALDGARDLARASEEDPELAFLFGTGDWIWWGTAIRLEGGLWPCLVLEGEVEDAWLLRPLWKRARPVVDPAWGPVLDADRDRRAASFPELAGPWPPTEGALERAERLLGQLAGPAGPMPEELERRL